MRLSRRTLGALVAALAAGRSHAWLSQKFYELSLEATDLGSTVHARALALVRALEQGPPTIEEDGAGQVVDDERGRESALLELATDVLRAPATADYRARDQLEAGLRVDGFEYREHRLTPTTPGAVALGPEISALETELVAAGPGTAATHYRQAVDSLTAGNAQACNGQVRPYLEDLFCQLGEGLTVHSRKDPLAALTDLRNAKHLDDGEWNLLRAFWEACNARGPHRGQSDTEEALFRVHIASAAGRYLLRKLR